jgi:hypothetical protein
MTTISRQTAGDTIDVPASGRWYVLSLSALAALSVGLAIRAASEVDTPVENDWGLVGVLPTGFWIGLFTLNVLMVIAIRARRLSRPLLTLLLVSLVVALYGAPIFATGTPRGEVAWRHLGIVGAISANGRIDPEIDGYFNWPGFFAGLAGLVESTGVSAQTIALVAPIFNVLLWLVATAVVVRAFTKDSRHLWLSLWLFALGNWIDQDYLSPQAFGFFLHVALFGVVLTSLTARPTLPLSGAVSLAGTVGGIRLWWTSREPVEPDAHRRVAALIIAVLLGVAIVISHQLTPFVLIVSLLLLTLAGRCWTPGLVLIVGLALVIWLETGASTYLAGHPVLFVSDPDQVVAANLGERINGSDGHVAVVAIRTTLMLFMWALALCGFVRLYRRGTRDLRPLVLFTAPFLMIPTQSYGGEMVLRTALFTLPFTAYLMAGLLLPGGRRLSYPLSALTIVVCLVISLGTVTARYGNARFDMFTPAEIEGSRQLYARAPTNALLISGAHPTPWRYRSYVEFRHDTITDLCENVPNDAPACLALIRGRALRNPEGALVMLNRANRESLRMQGELPALTFEALAEMFSESPDARLIYRNRDVLIFQYPPLADR